jgi:LysR family transcriptional regulator, hca operon transcriptional activator
MDLRYLRFFVTVAEEMNFTRAAERLRTAQPSLSLQMRKLEEDVGVDLFVREGRGIALTDAGRVFLDGARKTLAEVDRNLILTRQAAKGEIGHLSIGYDAPAEFRVFPKVVPAFGAKWPDVRLSFHNLKNAQQLEGLRQNQLDVGFVFLPVAAAEFDIEPLVQVPVIVALPARHPLAAASAVSIKDLSGERLILFPRSLDPETYNQIQQLFLAAHATMNVVLETASLLSAINFVSLGTGCSFLGDYARLVTWKGVVYKPLDPPTLVKTVAVIKKKGKGGLADSFYRFVSRFMSSRTKCLS